MTGKWRGFVGGSDILAGSLKDKQDFSRQSYELGDSVKENNMDKGQAWKLFSVFVVVNDTLANNTLPPKKNLPKISVVPNV